jgi:hypothetical protein
MKAACAASYKDDGHSRAMLTRIRSSPLRRPVVRQSPIAGPAGPQADAAAPHQGYYRREGSSAEDATGAHSLATQLARHDHSPFFERHRYGLGGADCVPLALVDGKSPRRSEKSVPAAWKDGARGAQAVKGPERVGPILLLVRVDHVWAIEARVGLPWSARDLARACRAAPPAGGRLPATSRRRSRRKRSTKTVPRDEADGYGLIDVSREGGLPSAAGPVAIRLNPLPTDGWW